MTCKMGPHIYTHTRIYPPKYAKDGGGGGQTQGPAGGYWVMVPLYAPPILYLLGPPYENGFWLAGPYGLWGEGEGMHAHAKKNRLTM